MSFTKKLYYLIGFVVLGIVTLSVVSDVSITKVHDAANYANINSIPSIEQIDKANDALLRMRIAVWQAIAADNPQQEEIARKKIVAMQSQLESALKTYEDKYIDDSTDQELLKEDREALKNYYRERDIVLSFAENGQGAEARAKQLSIQPAILRADKSLVDHRAYNLKLSEKNSEIAEETLQLSRGVMLAIAIVVALVLTCAAAYLVRHLSKALFQAVGIAEAVAAGDLTVTIPAHGDDEAGRVLSAMSTMTANLTEMIQQVQLSAGTISTAVSEIASGNLDLSSRTEHQASTLEETASSMEEMASAVRQNETHAHHAKELAQGASTVAQNGMKMVHDVVSTMSDINIASGQIKEIISVIESITFQTNILALNAAVEAARAGEQGKGFAVVASEVRALAQRSSAAAKDIKTLIDQSVTQIQAGNELATRTGDTMTRIVNSVDEVSEVITEISSASSEQAAGIGEINDAIIQMDGVTQQNAALVEEAAASAAAMQEQTKILTTAVAAFKTTKSLGRIVSKPKPKFVESLR